MSTSPGSTTASSTIASPTITSPPVIKRRGMHPIFGIFVVGSPLTLEYALHTPNGYSGTSQLRSEKILNLA